MTAARLRDQAPATEVDPAIRQGVDHLGQGRLLEAELLFTAALARDQGSFQALQFLGVVRMQQGRQLEALDLINRAVKQRRRSPEALALQGVLLSHLDRDGEALESFDKVLAVQPGHVETLYNRGVALGKLGRRAEAIESYRTAVALRPGYCPALLNLANNLAALQQYDDALATYDALIACGGLNVDVLNNRGNVLFSLDRFEQALADYDRGLALATDHLDLLGNRAKALTAMGRREEALASYERMLAVAPGHVAALTERGAVLVSLDRPQEALASLDAALAINGASVAALNDRCAALHRLGRFEDSLADANRALAIDPQNALGYFGRGNAFSALNRFEQAVECYQTSLAFGPGVANAHKNLAGALNVLDRHDDALAHYEQALALGANDDETKASRSLVYLSLGRFAEGWAEYDSRFGADPTAPRRDYPQPRWNGEAVPGTLLVWGEQGLGDQILYGSMLGELVSCAERVVVEVEPRLVDLFARSFPAIRVVAIGDKLYGDDVCAHAPIGSLGRHLRPNAEAFPRRPQGFLAPDAARAAALRARLKSDGRTVVGLSWKSQNPKFEKAKSARLLDFESVLRLPNCRFVDLQYGDTCADREAVERELGVPVEHLDDIDNTKDIDGLAALMAACDAVVTVSNTTAHLAGALGRPTLVFVPYGHARLWYWFKDRDDSPWYPRLRVKRQWSGQSWAALIAASAQEVAAAIAAPQAGSPAIASRCDVSYETQSMIPKSGNRFSDKIMLN